MFHRIHRDALSAILGIVVLAGLITLMLVLLNPAR
jgi:hypothetical protein